VDDDARLRRHARAAFTAYRNLWFHTGDAVRLDAGRN
jgi:hypothetical protein